MISTMLIPLDGSRAAEAALGYATLFPATQIRLLRVETELKEPIVAGPAEREAWRVSREEEARAYLATIADSLRQTGREVEVRVAWGDPAGEILAHAEGVDLILMTTHGRGAVERILFGSVADRVARHAPVPVMLVRAADEAETPPQIARILVPLDGSDLAARALPVAAEVAAALDAPIALLRVVDIDVVRGMVQAGVAAGIADAAAQEAIRQRADAELDARAARLRDEGRRATALVLTGSPVAELLHAIHPDDLIVMTTHGYGGIRRWLLGSIADKVIREATAPVLLVRSGAAPAS